VLQSDSVKRLFNRPNLIIKTIPLKLAESDNTFWYKRNGISSTSNHIRPSEISIFPVRTEEDEEKEDINLLPSKIEHKKSEIALLPIKKKSCGHYESCEKIVCDVTLQQYVDKDGMSPMLASSIEENEINAPVEKHCENKYCDALSIDHNRCRRALIKLRRCDRSHMCDVCGITFKKWISRVYHRNCMRKKEYVHIDVDRLHLLKERMRMRELQILEMVKMKKRDYSDPDKVIEILRRNEELIIIPQKPSSQRPIVSVTSVPNTQLTSTNLINVQSIKNNSHITKATNIFESVPLTSQNINNTSYSENKVKLINQIKFLNLQQNSHLKSTSIPIPTRASTPVQAQTQVPVATSSSTSVPTLALTLAPSSASAPVSASTSASVSTSTSVSTLALTLASNSAPTSTSTSVPTLALTLAPTSVSVPVLTPISASDSVTTSASTPNVPPHKQYIRLAVSSQSTVQPITFLAPIRVVPITNLISPPSLLHRTQGIPKFCIVAENVTPTRNSSSVRPIVAAPNTATGEINTSNLIHNPIPKVRKTKLMKAKKNFFCVYCSKNITTDWYFKMHIAKHKGEKLFFCTFCDESFSNNYDMKKHITNQHTDQKELACDKCDYTCTSLASFKSHIQTHTVCNLNKVDVHLKKQRKLKLSEDEISHKLIHKKEHKRKIKRRKYENTSDSQNAHVGKHNNKESMINIDSNAKTKEFHFVSVKKIVEPENFEQESAITSR